MSFELTVRPPFREEWTQITIAGEHEDELLNILASRLGVADWEVLIETPDGEMVSYEEFLE